MDPLYHMGEWIEKHQDSIVNGWLANDKIIDIFSAHKISLRKFSDTFAYDILRHAIDVIQGIKKMQDCPIMNKFVNYMLEKDITSEDILNICTPLRSTVILHLFKSYKEFAKETENIEKILLIFDTNLAGVLKNYDTLKEKVYNSNEKRALNLKTYLNRLQVILNAQDNIIFKLHDNQFFIGNKALYDAAEVEGLTEFTKKFSPPLSFIKHVDFYDTLFQNQDYDEWIKRIIEKHNGHCQVELFHKLANKTSIMRMKIIQIGELGNYVFTLHDITEKSNSSFAQNGKRSTDPLTKLNNLKGFEELLENKLKDASNKNLKILMLELKGLSLFSEQNSQEQSDLLIKEIANSLDAKHPNEVSRIDNNRFVILSNNLTLDDSNNLIQELEKKLKSSPNTNNLNISAAIVLLHENETTSQIIDRGEILLEYIKETNLKQVVDKTIIDKEESKRKVQEKKLLTLMKKYKKEKQTLPVTNYYLEIPLKSDAQIINVTEDEMTLSIRKIAAAALSKNDYVYLEMSEKPNFRGTIKSVDIDTNQITLYNFKPLETSPLERRNIYVKLKAPIEVTLKSKKVKIIETLESLSINTFVIFVNHLYDIEVDSKLTIDLKLEDREMEYSGHVLKIVPIADKFKLIIRLEVTEKVEDSLSHFISSRQLETIKELQEKTSF
ncbi:MAG: diguanylate cyclase [Sulfurimonas sp.]